MVNMAAKPSNEASIKKTQNKTTKKAIKMFLPVPQYPFIFCFYIEQIEATKVITPLCEVKSLVLLV